MRGDDVPGFRFAPSGLRRRRLNQQRSASFYNGAVDRPTSRRRNQQRSASVGNGAPRPAGAERERLQAVCKRSKLARRRATRSSSCLRNPSFDARRPQRLFRSPHRSVCCTASARAPRFSAIIPTGPILPAHNLPHRRQPRACIFIVINNLSRLFCRTAARILPAIGHCFCAGTWSHLSARRAPARPAVRLSAGHTWENV